MIYPLLFPYGDDGWTDKVRHVIGNKTVTQLQWYAYHMAGGGLSRFDLMLPPESGGLVLTNCSVNEIRLGMQKHVLLYNFLPCFIRSS